MILLADGVNKPVSDGMLYAPQVIDAEEIKETGSNEEDYAAGTEDRKVLGPDDLLEGQ